MFSPFARMVPQTTQAWQFTQNTNRGDRKVYLLRSEIERLLQPRILDS